MKPKKKSPIKKAVAVVRCSMLRLGLFGIAFAAGAAPADEKMTYDAAREDATKTFIASRESCNQLAGNPKNVCIAEAKAAQVFTEASARAQYKKTLAAATDARKDIAEADYEVERVRCASRVDNARDVCIQEAKATLVAALADAKADRKVSEARTDAREDKRSADYKVALEKCDEFAGEAKGVCVADVKDHFGK